MPKAIHVHKSDPLCKCVCVCVYAGVCVPESILSGANCRYLSLRKNCTVRQIGVCVCVCVCVCVSGIDFPATVNCSAIREVVLHVQIETITHTHSHTHTLSLSLRYTHAQKSKTTAQKHTDWSHRKWFQHRGIVGKEREN